MAKNGKSSKGISYRKSSAGSTRGISASQWNGFLEMHKDYYNGTADQKPLPAALRGSTIAFATLAEDAEPINAYQPCRIVNTVNYDNFSSATPAFVVEPVDREDTDKHGDYAFTVSEGIGEGGGRIVIQGLALVLIEAQELYYNKLQEARNCSYDASYYMVPDNTLSADLDVIAPVGHFRITGWSDSYLVSGFEADKKIWLSLDMNRRATTFNATTADTIPAATEASDIFTWVNGDATPMFPSDNATVPPEELDVSSDVGAYQIQVFNNTGAAVPAGEHVVSYSLEYNRFIIVAASTQNVKIGKADADITAGSTGTISIWRDGVDTTENVEAVELDWMHGGTKVSSGKEVMITFFADEGKWRITGAECE